ncbi:hypothetical protein E4T39_07865 [Aureobasidium subglaciale]|nr:hypothetical protein E4T39_07865 [Aureobasidium subglaciale]
MEPWQSWLIALGAAAAAYYYYVQHGKPVANRTRAASVSDFVAPQPKAARRRDSTKPKPKSETTKATAVTLPELSVQSGEDSTTRAPEVSKKRKAGKKQSAAPAPSLTPAPAPKRQEVDDDVAEEEDNKAWAQQLASLKKGTSLAPPSRTDSRNRTVKQSSKNFSPASSNADNADDDLTPAMSPRLAAGDVSDMLEPTAGGPSVLRLTGSNKPTKANQPRQQSQAEEQETKKQRQNRKKVEERRLQREAEEKERQTLLETQRRTAREARGEPAKNGIPVSKAPTSSAWAAEVAKRATEPPVVSESAPLLDTFEQSATNGASEEDQLALAKQISQDDSGWNTVPKGKKQQKKATPVAGSEDSNASDAGSVVNAPIKKVAPLPKVTAPAPKATTASTNGYSSLYDSGYDAGSHPDDSQWAA